MPLRVSRRADTGTLWITGTVRPAGAPQGVRVRRRAGTDDPRAAREEAAVLEADILRRYHHGERPVARPFSQAVLAYLKFEERTPGTKALVRRLLLHFGDTPVAEIGQEAVDKATGILLRPGAAPATVRRNLIVPLRAILAFASRRQWCPPPVFDIPRVPAGRTLFLLPDQAQQLLAAAAEPLRTLLLFLLGTGCRMGEALALEWTEVDLAGGRIILWEGETKGGQRRIVRPPPAVIAAMAAIRYPARDELGRRTWSYEREGRVFRDRLGRDYRIGREDGGGGGQIRTAWATACRKAGLPGDLRRRPRPDRPGEVEVFAPELHPHDLRHTWATWHYALWRDLLRLRDDGGWSSAAQVERYAHLMPEGREAAIRAIWGMLAPVPGRRAEAG